MNWETIIMAVVNNLLEIVLAAIFVVVFGFLKKKGYLSWILDNDKFLTQLAEKAVLFAQQKYGHLVGEERYVKALEWMIKELDRFKIKVDIDTLEGYIESILKLLKEKFGEKWKELKEEDLTD